MWSGELRSGVLSCVCLFVTREAARWDIQQLATKKKPFAFYFFLEMTALSQIAGEISVKLGARVGEFTEPGRTKPT